MLTPEEKRVLRKNLTTYEGSTPHMYLDTRGNVTIGVGHLISSVRAAQQLPFQTQDAKRATGEEIRNEFENIRKRPYGAAYSATSFAKFTEIRLGHGAIDSLTDIHIQSFVLELRRLYPGFDTYPTPVRLGLFDMIFNLGMTRLRSRFPKFNQAIMARDWAKAARECRRPAVQASRNRYVQALFEEAAALQLHPAQMEQ